MQSMMALLAMGCFLLGFTPRWMIWLLGVALEPIGMDVSVLPLVTTNIFDLSFGLDLSISNLPISRMLGLALVLVAIPFLVSLLGKVLRPDSAWNGGTKVQEPLHQQFSSVASSFLFHDTFTIPALNRVLNSIREYLPAHIEVSLSIRPSGRVEIFSAIYNFMIDHIISFSQSFGQWVQNRDIRRYLWYVFGVNLITLLIFILIKIGK
jgi:hypothetical protein